MTILQWGSELGGTFISIQRMVRSRSGTPIEWPGHVRILQWRGNMF
jgi:hypothetical protein